MGGGKALYRQSNKRRLGLRLEQTERCQGKPTREKKRGVGGTGRLGCSGREESEKKRRPNKRAWQRRVGQAVGLR